jgi:hypothetical protein
VEYHSIIGVVPPCAARIERFLLGSAGAGPGDGVVSYKSAHLDTAISEIVVPAEHSYVHHHPLAVQEVRRILLEHCNCRPQARAAAQPACGTRPKAIAPAEDKVSSPLTPASANVASAQGK